MNRILLIAFSLSLAFLGVSNGEAAPLAQQTLIVGGTDVPAGHPLARSTVALVMGHSLCTGSIVAPDLVITAAHCLYQFQGNVEIVFATTLSRTNAKAVATSSRFIVHPSYNPSKATADQNDLALIKLTAPLPRGYAPALLLPEGTPLKQGESVILAGYGITDASTKTGAGTLRATEVSVLKERLGRTEAVLDQTQGRGACHGDSGGPAFLQIGSHLYLWGVTSRGYPNRSLDDCAHDVVYTQIGEQMRFLETAATELRR